MKNPEANPDITEHFINLSKFKSTIWYLICGHIQQKQNKQSDNT